MPKWEYKLLVAEKHGKGVFGHLLPKEVSWKVHYVNGRQVTNWQDSTLYNYLDKVGQEGWEMVGMTSHVSIRSGSFPIEHLYISLKRQV